MNLKETEIMLESKKRFNQHQWLYVTVKSDVESLPYSPSPFDSILEHSRDSLHHKHYILYIHDKYLTIRADGFNYEPVKLLIDDKIWIELFYLFDVNVKKTRKDKKLAKDRDNEPV